MAESGVRLHQENLSCSICTDVLEDPVAIPCGHSYCMKCINGFWDRTDQRGNYSCPQCRQTFKPRPVLGKNIMLADLVEQIKMMGLQETPADHCYAGPEDVACDVCRGRKLKALKSCMVCLASYCEKHLQPHYSEATFKKHNLVDPVANLQENICSRHPEVMRIFCRTDRQIICSLCTVEEHRGHDTVLAEVERNERQGELEASRQEIQQRIRDREEDVKLLQQQLEAAGRSADKAVKDSEQVFTELVRLVRKRGLEVKQQIRSQQKADARRVKSAQEELQQEIKELKSKDVELGLLVHMGDHNRFLQHYPWLPQLREATSSIKVHLLSSFDDLKAAVSDLRDKIRDILRDGEADSALTVAEPEPETRAEFLRHSCEITLDPRTAHRKMLLSMGNRRAEQATCKQPYPGNPDRFTGCIQVLSKESLTGRCYWEVERRGKIDVAVAYKDIDREGPWNESGFGCNDKSWSLYCGNHSYRFRFNNVQTPVSGPVSYKLGVYLDHGAGTLSFYSVANTMTLLHRVQTTFTQPLYAGVWLYSNYGDMAEFCKLK